MNESVHNSTDSRSETGDREDGHGMSTDSGTSASMMQSAVLTDLQLIYMLQQQQQQGAAGEAAMMLSPGSLPLLMSSCQVMALHPSVSQQFVSSSSTGTSPSSLARSPLLAPDGSIIWHPAGADDQLSDNFDEDHNQGTSFSQHPQGNGGLSQQPESPVVSRNPLQVNSHLQPMTVNGNMAAYPGYSVVNAASTVGHCSGFLASVPPKVVVTTPPKTNLAAPKKPLTPYMKFSKSIWQHVKNANPSMSVCEVGASIGRLWREMADTDKQKYNDEFQREKAVYEVELQTYLRATGLQVSDLTKSKKKDTRDRSKASSNSVATPNQNYAKNVMAPPLSHSSPATSAAGHDGGDAEGTRLPHISQMWSGHSSAQQPQAASHVQNLLKTVCDPFETARLKTVEVNTQSVQQHDAHSSPGGATVVSSEMPSGLSWTWIKAVDPGATNDPNRSFSFEALDSLQSAYTPQDQGSLSAVATPTNQQPVMEFYSASDSLEPGEVVVEGLQPTLIAKVSASLQNGSVASAHNMYNSYAVNPWNRYKLAAGTGPKAGEAIFDKEQILHTELVHLRGSLSEKTKEVDQLSKELEIAYALISKLQQQDNPSSHPALHPGDDASGTPHQVDQPDGILVSQEPGREPGCLSDLTDQKQVLQNDTESGEIVEPARRNVASGEPVLEKQELKQNLNPDIDMKPTGSERFKVASKFPPRINNLHSTKMQDIGFISEPGGCVVAEKSSAEGQPQHLKIASSRKGPLSTPGKSHQILPVIQQCRNQPATDNMEITTEQPTVVGHVSEQQNVVMLHFESNMQQEEHGAGQNQELEMESVASDRQEVVSEETASTVGSSGEELKDSGEAAKDDLILEPKEMIQP